MRERGGKSSIETPLRKLDHIRLVVDSEVEHKGTTLLEEVFLYHNALPELDFNEVDLATSFLGHKLSAPIIVTGMTGGHPVARDINCSIAEAVEELGLAMGVGSQRAAIEDPKLEETFSIARKCAPTSPIIANIGAPQLAKGYGVREIAKAIEMLEADAVAIHLNPAQEVFQPEGDYNFTGVLEKIREIVEVVDVPVIVKETGHGLSMSVVQRLHRVGVEYFDVSGAGGTSWILVEKHRSRIKGARIVSLAADTYSYWGVPTAEAIIEARWAAPTACIIASGGVRTGLDVAKSLALGADIAGLALPVIRAYASGRKKAIVALLEKLLFELRVAAFLTGCKTAECLKKLASFTLGSTLSQRIENKGIKIDYYIHAKTINRRC